MKIKALVPSLALISALALTGAASAQSMIGDQEVPPEEFDAVLNYCLDLQAGAVGGEETAPEADDLSDDPAVEDDASSNALSVDLTMITLADCEEAGFLNGEGSVDGDAGVDALPEEPAPLPEEPAPLPE